MAVASIVLMQFERTRYPVLIHANQASISRRLQAVGRASHTCAI
jgi:hypothetical protein